MDSTHTIHWIEQIESWLRLISLEVQATNLKNQRPQWRRFIETVYQKRRRSQKTNYMNKIENMESFFSGYYPVNRASEESKGGFLFTPSMNKFQRVWAACRRIFMNPLSGLRLSFQIFKSFNLPFVNSKLSKPTKSTG